MLTTQQIRERTKTVTRRVGWERLRAGELVCAVVKGMGLRKGESIERLGVLRIVDVRPEPLERLTVDLEYGIRECELEGFGDDPRLRFPSEFVRFFCASHRGCTPETVVRRIEFQYMEDG